MKNFKDGEAECNKLPGGHLASFHTQQQMDFLINMTGFVSFLLFKCKKSDSNFKLVIFISSCLVLVCLHVAQHHFDSARGEQVYKILNDELTYNLNTTPKIIEIIFHQTYSTGMNKRG